MLIEAMKALGLLVAKVTVWEPTPRAALKDSASEGIERMGM